MKIIVANWKMNGDFDLADRFIVEINAAKSPHTIVICPPAILISRFVNFRYHLGAQNCFCEESGAFTGENSPRLLKEAGCDYVILGHSERRSIFGESNELIFRKWDAAQANRLIPIVCIGEKLEDRERWTEVMQEQLRLFLKAHIPSQGTIFAYEPVWSIGTGLVLNHKEIEDIFAVLKNLVGDGSPLLYGGSVNATNASDILACTNVDGLLIGGASLRIDEFLRIIS
ncbi:MAG: triose-phosphate isomerase [Holosporaceae bacterium]|jgi:triosephosphate isomerase|nr:triose-phosphate isomerase [Holosporaceae bacterium]